MKIAALAALLATTAQAAACPLASDITGWKAKVMHSEGELRDITYSPRGLMALGMKPVRVDGTEKQVEGKWIPATLTIVLPGGDAVPHYPAFIDTYGSLADGKLSEDTCEDGLCVLHPRGQFAPEKAGDLWMVELAQRQPGGIYAWRRAKKPELQLTCTYDVQPG